MDMFNAEETETCVTWKLFFRNKAKNSVNDTLPGISTILPLQWLNMQWTSYYLL